jgi:hypothetical protein
MTASATRSRRPSKPRTVNNRDGRPYEEKTISNYAGPARNLVSAWPRSYSKPRACPWSRSRNGPATAALPFSASNSRPGAASRRATTGAPSAQRRERPRRLRDHPLILAPGERPTKEMSKSDVRLTGDVDILQRRVHGVRSGSVSCCWPAPSPASSGLRGALVILGGEDILQQEPEAFRRLFVREDLAHRGEDIVHRA